MINLTIDGKAITVPKGTTVYQAAKQMGIEIPIFCYLDRMPPFGACRMCLVEVEKMGKLQASCTLEATEGMVVKTQSQMAKEGQEQILELLLINHPLDCPICDRGGECPLQDQTLKYGPGKSRFLEDKRHFTKPIPLGPVLMLDRERCITCARCTRFGEVIAGDHALEFIDRGYKTEVGTPDGGPAESKYIGNTIMICPVGALTSEVYRFRARPWDNDVTESACTLCPVGCNMYLDSRDGEIMRTRSRENRELNDIWLCDKGWFGYEFSSHPDRLQQPLIRREGILAPCSWDEALSVAAERLSSARGNNRTAAFGGNSLTFEESYYLQKLMREGLGVSHLDHRVGMTIVSANAEGLPPGMQTSFADCEKLSYVILLGLDLTEEFPLLWLRLRQAINKGAKVLFAGHYAPEIYTYLSNTVLHAPGHELETIKNELQQFLQDNNQGEGAIFVGSQYLASGNRVEILNELAKLNMPLNIMEGRENSMGARYAGMHPEHGPFNAIVVHPGLNALQVMQRAASAGWDLLYAVGCDPASKFPKKLWSEARSQLGFLIVQDLFLTDTAKEADLVLPTLSFVEKSGTFINIEGKGQRLNPGKMIPEGIYSDEEIFKELAHMFNVDLGEVELDVQVRLKASWQQGAKMGEQPSLAGTLSYCLFDRGVRMKRNTHLVQMAKDPVVRMHAEEMRKHGLQDGEVAEFRSEKGALAAKVKADARVAKGTVVFPLGFPECPSHVLAPDLVNGFSVEVKTVH